mgnify:CR=1 FL=1
MSNKELAISVIISTYNMPEWLEKVLWGYEQQTYKNFEIIIADDGSGEQTKKLIDTFKSKSSLNIEHVWHKDNGFQKCKILNKAITKARFDYILFSDGDCIPRKDFLAVHAAHAAPGHFLSGGYFKLPMNISKKITREDIVKEHAFDLKWLLKNGLKKSIKTLKLTSEGRFEKLLNWITPTNASWNGHNASGWKADILKVNGYNEDMAYGGEDRELGERLFNLGIRSKQLRYSAICIHLDHSRGYVDAEVLKRNLIIRKNTLRTKSTFTKNGIEKH